MKFYQMFTLLVLSSLLIYKAQGINRKLMTENGSSTSTTTNLHAQNPKNVGNKHEMKPEVQSTHGLVGKEKKPSFKSSPDNSKQWKKEVVTNQYPDAIEIAGMDYTPARKKSPIHN